MKIISEKIVNTDKYAGTVDIITGIDNFDCTCTYNEEWHTYRLNGKIIPSVTQLLSDDEYIDVALNILEYARKKGTLVHKEIENFLKKGEYGFTKEFEEFLRLFNENKELFEKEGIFDIKTYSTLTKKNKSKCYSQCELYSGGIKYLTGKDIADFYMIWLPHTKEGKIIKLEGE